MMPCKAMMIVGAPKAGTTTLHDALSGNKALLMPTIKEPSFFNEDENYKWGMDYYFKQYYPGMEPDSVIVDCSPLYAQSASAASRIKSALGDRVKIIIIVRDPVDRAYSHYLHNRRDEIYDSQLSFEEALAETTAGSAGSDCVRYSLYHEMIDLWVHEFGRSNVLVLRFESDIAGDLQEGVNKVCDFCDIDRFQLVGSIESNVAKESKKGFSWIRKIFFSDSSYKRAIKRLVPPLYRHKFRLLFNELTSREITTKKTIDPEKRRLYYQKYFKEEMAALKRDYNIDYSV